ncbi:trypsin-like peptidase domain-containing protein [Saccharothrix sp. NPDC042600]|uniref:trypsin-like serine peptidase n=1 Tax=Saccharothrix TaxID=2071 RepID=UPI0033CCF9DF
MTTTTRTAADRLRQLVAVRSTADRSGAAPESVPVEEVDPRPGADEVTGRVEAALDQVPPWVDDADEFRRAREILLRETRIAGERLDADPAADLTAGEVRTLEAVVRADGSRPTLFVRDDRVDEAHPMIGRWAGAVAAAREALRPVLQAVGRIQPDNATGDNFFGTGWVVDAENGLVLTNLHVMEVMWRRLRQAVAPTDTGFRVLDGAHVDFAAESGRTRTRRFRVVEARSSGVDGPDYARLDAAVLRIEPIEHPVPQAVPVLADPDGPNGVLASLCTVGYPGRPAYQAGTHEGIDWAWVNNALFGHRYGVKRLAPGTAHRPPGFTGAGQDPRAWVFGHDCTTLGGSSGSPVVAWLGDAPGAFGLHFAGASADTNLAHAVSACAGELRALGVPV